jgi:hypothetical protein
LSLGPEDIPNQVPGSIFNSLHITGSGTKVDNNVDGLSQDSSVADLLRAVRLQSGPPLHMTILCVTEQNPEIPQIPEAVVILQESQTKYLDQKRIILEAA